MCISPKVHNDEVEAVVKLWIDKVIIGLNFCPFAKKEIQRNTVRYAIYASTHVNDALSQFIEELAILDQQQDIQTTLLVFSNGFSDFEEYLDMLGLANSLMEQGGYGGIYQVASFHPDYCFDGEAQNDPANYTNRSPYPILHILRESSIEDALKRYPEPESIPKNNIAKARKLGSSFLKALLK
ncbi:DUF1415 domain-containing protein [Paraglaciecola psychrophila]|uniref:Uncharacterized protein n=1 Tax=Paraglaciecola psychrophila 170 TaxID=1129794 RepID=K7A528_9ALTE|nr:DUF1415 domain-containing protein [Paraglaciecola psychrophila]AGH45917.1 hypothetical protein C427_3809 [Paraglaciecola psychrophila 170]GAC37467.1 hypothetical protein GPSY_1838 [Paraglaciecola psychrophila 170]